MKTKQNQRKLKSSNSRALFLSLVLPLAFGTVPANATVTLPAIFGDHMVLQQGGPAVWGKAQAGSTLTVSLAGKTVTATAGTDGKWKAAFAALKAGGPYDLTVSGDGAVTFTDVLVGDVWLGSGQSNMEFSLKASQDADKQVPLANQPKIRLFTVPRMSATVPQDDLKGSWRVCTPDSADRKSTRLNSSH